MPALIDLSGQKFGKLTVVSRNETPHAKPRWNCICDCGNKCIAHGSDLRAGKHRSCGCLQKEAVTKHGRTTGGKTSPEYRTWQGMKNRCLNPNSTHFAWYGGRGISVCDRWLTFENFLADMGERPPGHTLERKDSNGNYEPQNCRWATMKEQGQNRCSNRMVSINGVTLTVSQWSDKSGLPYNTLRNRIRLGWASEDLLLPIQPAEQCEEDGRFAKRKERTHSNAPRILPSVQ